VKGIRIGQCSDIPASGFNRFRSRFCKRSQIRAPFLEPGPL
jgi:hypothetical protein